MKINLILLLIALLGAGTYTYTTNNTNTPIFTSRTNDINHSTKATEAINNFTYNRLDGEKGNLHSHKGRTVLIHFWATWCAPCIVELPQLIDLAFKSPNIDVLAISTDQNTDKVRRFIKKTGKKIPDNFILITDAKNEIAQDRFQTIRLPETFILAPDLSIHEKIVGAHEGWAEPEMLKKLNILSNATE